MAIAISLNVQATGAGGSSHGPEMFARILAGEYQSPAFQASWQNQRLENSKQRNPVDTPFVLPPSGGPTTDRGRRAIIVDEVWFRCISSGDQQNGRSPPDRIS